MLRGVWTSLAAEYIHPTKHTHLKYTGGRNGKQDYI